MKKKGLFRGNYYAKKIFVEHLRATNGLEGWANWRRTDYPKLKANTYPGSEIPGEFIRTSIDIL